MTAPRPSDRQLAEAIRGTLPVGAEPSLRARILAEATTTPQRRGGAWSILTVPAPPWRAVALLAALLLALAVGAVIVGSANERRERTDGDLLIDAPHANGRIAVAANPWSFFGGQNGDIYLLGDGKPPRRIIGSDRDGIAQACPQFAPDGRRLAYGESLASGHLESLHGEWMVEGRAVVVVSLGGDDMAPSPVVRVALPEGPPGPMICPEWSPTGDQIAFRAGSQLWIADAVSGATSPVDVTSVDRREGRESPGLAWSRDGSMIAVAEPRRIRVIAVDTGESTLIPVADGVPQSLGWSADDTGLVYLSVDPQGGYGSGVHVVRLDGRNDRLLTRQASQADVTYMFDDATISADGTQVAFRQGSGRCTNDRCGPGSEVAPIEIANLDGSRTEELPLPADGSLPVGPSGTGYFVSGINWSPDGTRLLLSSIDGVASIGRDPASPATVYTTGALDSGLNLEWSWSELTWQPLRD